MFDSPANRFVYEDALSRHSELMDAETMDGKAYRFGYRGVNSGDNPMLSYEHWRAGKENARRHAGSK